MYTYTSHTYVYIYMYVAKHPQPYHRRSFVVRPSTSPQSTYINQKIDRTGNIIFLSSFA